MSTTIRVKRGDTDVRTLTFKDSSGDAIDITAYKIWFTVKTNATDADPGILQKTLGPPPPGTPATGITTLTLTSSDTALTVGSYVYDFQSNDGSNVITTLGSGKFVIEQDITTTATL